jgi:hypothetical protein
MSDRFLEQRINTKFRVKLRKNASEICAMPFDTYERKTMQKSSVSDLHKWFKEDRKNVEDDVVVVQNVTEPMEVLKQ